MAMLRMLGLLLCVQVSLVQASCAKWDFASGDKDVCCEECKPGHHLYKACGPDPAALCTPCEKGTYSENRMAKRCERCVQCVGVQVELKACTSSSNTQCGCKEGLACGDKDCTFCVDRCGRGREPDEKRSCRPCPPGTFNDQIHQKCKPWSTRCPNSEDIVVKGDAFSDIKCNGTSVAPVTRLQIPDGSEVGVETSVMVISIVVSGVTLVVFAAVILVVIVLKKRRRKVKVTLKEIKRTPTDAPQTLIATECSYHEAEQEQGSSDSKEQLIL